MTKKEARRNIRLYWWYEAFSEPLFVGPILISSLMHLGKMSIDEIYIMEAVVMIGAIFFEVPTGAIADLIGRKRTMVYGSALLVLYRIWFANTQSVWGAWGANTLWMVGFSLCSGAESALLYDSLKVVNEEHLYQKVQGRAVSSRLLLLGVSSLATGFLAEVHPRLPLFLSIPGAALSCLFVFFLKEPTAVRKYSRRDQLSIMKASVLFVANHQVVKWVIGFSTLLGVASKLWFFSYNPYFELVSLDVRYYGVIFFLLNMIAWFSSLYGDRLVGVFREKQIITLMVLVVGVPILIMGSWVAIPAVGMIFFQNIFRGFSGPFLGEFINRHLDSENRATVLSVQSAIGGLFQFVAMGTFGLMLHHWNLPFCLQVLGVTVLVLGFFYIVQYRKVFGKG